MNRYPLWKYLLIVAVLVVGFVYALPNIFGDDPALQVSPTRTSRVDTETRDRLLEALKQAEVEYMSYELADNSLLVRFPTPEVQLKAYDVARATFSGDYTVALNLAPATPDWLESLGALPMYLGLDLRGGVHFMLEVDMEAAVRQALERYVGDFRAALRDERVRYVTIGIEGGKVAVKFRSAEERAQAMAVLNESFRALDLAEDAAGGDFFIYAAMSEQEMQDIRKFALQQNITTLRNRVNEIGVAEPVIQQQGQNRIVVQLPGVQDTARAKEILGATATLEYHMVDEEHDLEAALAGRVPPGSRLYQDRDGRPILLYKDVIVTGDEIIDAASGLEAQSGSPMVSVTLDAGGARKMSQNTRENVGNRMAVVFIENRSDVRMVDGEPQRVTKRVEEVISVAVIREHFSKRFQTTGLDSTEEARNLALLLRAGALAAPMEIVEERTVGPSLGRENISKGMQSVVIAMIAAIAFMAFYYRGFGFVANLALLLNLVLIVAVLSMLQATLTLPGIAGIVLTVGMAVDANVLIFERIREELRVGNTPQSSISAGYDKALSTIADANITTLIAAVVLFTFGTGPIKGFAVTLSIGILSSMFTAIMVTRAVVNLAVGGKRIKKLSI